MKKNASGRFVLRLPPAVHEELREEAARRGVSLNTFCQEALAARVAPGHQTDRADPHVSPMIAGIEELLGDSLVGVVLFGSTARGDSRAGSDVDLLIVVGPGVALTRKLYADWDARFSSGPYSPHFVHLPVDPLGAGSLWFEAAVDGIVRHDPDEAISRFLAAIRRAILDGRLRRLSTHGHPYWVKNDGEGGEAHVQ